MCTDGGRGFRSRRGLVPSLTEAAGPPSCCPQSHSPAARWFGGGLGSRPITRSCSSQPAAKPAFSLVGQSSPHRAAAFFAADHVLWRPAVSVVDDGPPASLAGDRLAPFPISSDDSNGAEAADKADHRVVVEPRQRHAVDRLGVGQLAATRPRRAPHAHGSDFPHRAARSPLCQPAFG